MAMLFKILYLGPTSGTCLDRANALRRLGHEVQHLDLRCLLPQTPWVDRVTWRLGGHLFSPILIPRLSKMLEHKKYEVCWVDGGEYVTPKLVFCLRQHAKKSSAIVLMIHSVPEMVRDLMRTARACLIIT